MKERGFLKCANHPGAPGMSAPDDSGKFKGLDIDFCKAVAAAIFGSPDKLELVPVSSKARFPILQSGEVDMVSRGTTWTAMRDTKQGVDYIGTLYFDGQGFIVRKDLGITKLSELSGATICLTGSSTTEVTLADYFRANNMTYKSALFDGGKAAFKAYQTGACDAYSGDQANLAGNRLAFKNPDDHVILPEIVSKEPLTPYVRHGDNQWADIVRYVRHAIVAAEELNITQANVGDMRANSTIPEVRRLLGVEGDIGTALGLNQDWAFNAVSAVGNYGEIWERNIAPLGLERGYNRLYTDGGLMYPIPFR